MTDHSPTPWFADDRDVFTQDGVACKRPIIAENSANWDANAAFIVKAVNNHNEAIGFLEFASKSLWRLGDQAAAHEIDRFLGRVGGAGNG